MNRQEGIKSESKIKIKIKSKIEIKSKSKIKIKSRSKIRRNPVIPRRRIFCTPIEGRGR